MVPSLYLELWKVFSASLQIIVGSCSISGCNFGVPIGGGELRVFLLCHLGYTPLPPSPPSYLVGSDEGRLDFWTGQGGNECCEAMT